MDKKKFARTVLNKNVEAFVVYVASFRLIHLAKKAYIAFMIAEKVKILAEYLNFSNVFFKKKGLLLSKLTKFN